MTQTRLYQAGASRLRLCIVLASSLGLLFGACGDDISPQPDAAPDADGSISLDGSPDADAELVEAGADAEPLPDAASDAEAHEAGMAECAHCLDRVLGWGNNGGRVRWTDLSSIAPCRAYRRERTPSGSTMPSLTCEATVPCAIGDATTSAGGDATAMEDVAIALARSDVQRLLMSEVALVGRDTRPTDAPIFSITYGDRTILIGSTCAGEDGCIEPPAGIMTLIRVLRDVDWDTNDSGACASFADS